MQLKYGNYAFVANACDIRSRFITLKNHGGQPYSTKQALEVVGFLQVSGQADCTAQMNALASALSVPYLDLILYQDSGSASATALLNANSISGVVVTLGPEFMENKGGEYSVYRKFSFTAEAEYPLSGSSGLLLSFQETVTFSGGLAKRAVLPAVIGPNQAQTIYPKMPYLATQYGESIGYRAYPSFPAPNWPSALLESPETLYVSPDRMGKGYQGYKISWRYNFGSVTQLTGAPHIWIS